MDERERKAPVVEARLTGPEVGTLHRMGGKYRWAGTVVRVVERSYVWGTRTPIRRYDWSVIEFEPGKRMVVNDSDLTPLVPGMRMAETS